MGKKIVLAINLWLVIKSIIYIVIDTSLWSGLFLFFAITAFYFSNLRATYFNYIIAVCMLVIMGINIWLNISDLEIKFVLQCVVDFICVGFLLFNEDVRALFEKM